MLRIFSGGFSILEDTAIAIARQVNILSNIPSNVMGQSLSGEDVDRLALNSLAEVVETVQVYYRTTPKHKMSIVRALQDRGHIVGMTGDGVNDSPALKLAVSLNP